MKRARELFAIGDRLRLSEDGRDKFPQLANLDARGKVVGFCRDDWKMRVRFDHASQGRTINIRYLERDPNPPTTTASAGAEP